MFYQKLLLTLEDELEVKLANFNHLEGGKKLKLDEPGSAVTMKFAASLKREFVCSDLDASRFPDCSEVGQQIPTKMECSFSDLYSKVASLGYCTSEGCVSGCVSGNTLCEK